MHIYIKQNKKKLNGITYFIYLLKRLNLQNSSSSVLFDSRRFKERVVPNVVFTKIVLWTNPGTVATCTKGHWLCK